MHDLDGGHTSAPCRPGPEDGELSVVSGGGPAEGVALWRVVRIERLGATLWQRLDGSLDAGASYASSSELLTLDLAARVILTRARAQFQPGRQLDHHAAAGRRRDTAATT